jgi:hypothetical protein
MAGLLVKRQHLIKPPSGYGVNLAHPLGKGKKIKQFYSFQEPNSGTVRDLITTNYNSADEDTKIVLTNVTSWKPTELGLGPYFNGTTSYGAANRVTLSTSRYTMAAWVKWNSFNASIGQVAGVESSYSAFLRTGNGTANQIQFNISGTDCTSPATLVTNKLYCIIGTYDGANIRLYINGALVTTTAKTGAISGNDEFRIGSDNAGARLSDMTLVQLITWQDWLNAGKSSN